MSAAREFAAGGVVGRAGEVLLVEVENLKGEIVWTFPKGHLEKKESWEDAALREVEEETGWECRITGPLKDVEYFFRRGETLVHKKVRWFRMEPMKKTGKPDATEIRKVKWVAEGKVAASLTYKSDFELLDEYRGMK